jgi:hypothetical protein
MVVWEGVLSMSKSYGQQEAEALANNVFNMCRTHNEACKCYQELLKKYDKRLVSLAWRNSRHSI